MTDSPRDRSDSHDQSPREDAQPSREDAPASKPPAPTPSPAFPPPPAPPGGLAPYGVAPRAQPEPGGDGPIDRRTFLKGGLLAGGLLVGGGVAIAELAQRSESPPAPPRPRRRTTQSAPQGPAPATGGPAAPGASAAGSDRPNILVIVVDQLRTPQWFTASPAMAALTPNIERLRREGVSFERHYTASNDCTPARATLLTGLYTHQTGCMITGGSTLDPGFPTWGTMLRDHGYETWWFGKWHLTHGDNHWSVPQDTGALEPYGFSGGTYPSPDGGPGQGWRVDPHVADQFDAWFAEAGARGPWCTTVSFVNPHDIAWWYKWSDRFAAEARPPRRVRGLPPNFETPEMLHARNKPLLQLSLQETAALSFGPVPLAGPDATAAWLPFMDLYVELQRAVDWHIGRVLRTLAANPDVAANTIVLFTSDHGEYGASHGLRGKGGGAYEEAIRVPLIVKDPRGELTAAVQRPRTQLSSSVDVAPLLLTIASGSDAWRSDPHYAHLARRADLARILADPGAPGRPHVLHATDEMVTEFALQPYAADAPLHVVALRTPTAKYVTYSDWGPRGIAPQSAGQQHELYDYRTRAGRMELDNAAGHSSLEAPLHAAMARAVHHELRGPLPTHLHEAHGRGFSNYYLTATHAATAAAAARLRRSKGEPSPAHPQSPFGNGNFNRLRAPAPAASDRHRPGRSGDRHRR
jgi:arylsulfatase A-like enzyme